MRRQLAAGGHVLAWDLAYWDRQRKVRVSIDAAHPQAWVLTHDWPADRLTADHLVVDDVWNPDGPVILAGIGEKARVQYGSAVATWEAVMTNACRRRGFVVVERPKQQHATVPIEQGGSELLLSGDRVLTLTNAWRQSEQSAPPAGESCRCQIPL